ncbi:CLM8 protein, partial [Geococcyx californianus]|nr:CLM8 protein [Geococcyx californianus]
MELRAFLLLPLCFPALQYRAPDAEERLSEGSTLQIQCPYPPHSGQQKKIWCRVKDDECELLGEALDPTQHPYTTRTTKGKVTMEDNRKDVIVSINMTDLQAEDSGTYSCAYRNYNFNYFAVKTISLIVFRELQKSELDRLSLQCPYSEPKYSMQTKAWCRKTGRTECNPVVRTDFVSTWRNSKDLEARSSIQDDTQNRTITITTEKLQAQDTGIYWCALYVYPGPTCIMEISLSVSKSDSIVNTFILISGVLSILVILALISLITLCVKRRKQLKRKGNGQEEDTHGKPEDIAQLKSSERMESLKDVSKDLKYATLNFKSRPSPEDPVYCNVEPTQAHRKPEEEYVEYTAIALK